MKDIRERLVVARRGIIFSEIIGPERTPSWYVHSDWILAVQLLGLPVAFGDLNEEELRAALIAYKHLFMEKGR